MEERFSYLCDEAPGFAVNGDKVKVITEPTDFYEELCQRAKTAKKKVVLASLYLGMGEKEQRLLNTIEESLQNSSDVRVKFLLDYNRGNRLVKGASSCTMLKPLLQKYQNIEAYFYHTPVLRGLPKKVLPTKLAETIGVQHCKVYLFDNSLIISGANLSDDYFTHRQDRYVLIQDCPKLADFFEGLVSNIAEFSLRLNKDSDDVTFDAGCDGAIHPYLGDYGSFVQAANEKITSFLASQLKENRVGLSMETDKKDTVIFTSVQMGQLQVQHDSEITKKFLNIIMGGGDTLKFATGYFNPTDEYLDTIVEGGGGGGQGHVDIVMAHPEANSFHNAPFPLYGVPFIYTSLASKFFDISSRERVQMYEYQRPGWTFHCKGLWVYETEKDLPYATMVGSPNFGYRSVEKDLEAQLTVLTKNRSLQEALHHEQARVFELSQRVTTDTFNQTDRIAPLWVKAISGIARGFF